MSALDVPFRLTLDFKLRVDAPTEAQFIDDEHGYASVIGDPDVWRAHVQALFASIAGNPDRFRRYVEADVRRRLGIDLTEATWDAAAPDDWLNAGQTCREIVLEAARAVGGETEAFVTAAQREGLWGERLGMLASAFEACPVSACVRVAWPEDTGLREPA